MIFEPTGVQRPVEQVVWEESPMVVNEVEGYKVDGGSRIVRDKGVTAEVTTRELLFASKRDREPLRDVESASRV